MRTVTLPVAYMPLVDAAPLIVAQDMGFAEAEGLTLDLIAAPSWSSLRDMLAFGRVDAAHMLSPLPVAMAMGLGSVATLLSAVSVLSVNGNVIGVGSSLENQLRQRGFSFDFADPFAAAKALAEVRQRPIAFGVPFPFSMHVALLRYWAAATELGSQNIVIRTVPPPLMASALANGDIDAFCVGEPWGSVAVEQNAGALLLPGKSIWSFAPEKVLATRTDWAEQEPELVSRLMRAVWKAGRWLGDPVRRTTASELLSRKEYLDLPAEIIDRALLGNLVVSGQGELRTVEGFVEFHKGAATFPWRSQSMWIAQQMRSIHNGPEYTREEVAKVFRADLHRLHLSGIDKNLPGASEKLEGAVSHPLPVASAGGGLTLLQNQFFDGKVFDPEAE